MSLEEREGLPVGWVATTLGEATKIVAGGTPSAGDPSNFETDSGIPWLTPADLSGYKKMYIGSGKRNLSQKGYHLSSATIMPSGSVLFSSRAPIGYVAIASNEISTNQGFKSFIITNEIYNKFLYFYLKSIKDIAEQAATGTTFKELSGAATSQLPLILPPLAEQVRIADKLDALLSRVEAGCERLERVPKLLKRFRQSVLSAAVSGELTREWRGGGEAEWSYKNLSDYAENLDGRRIPISEVERRGRHGQYPYYGASGVIDNINDFTHEGKFLLIGEDGANLITRSKAIAFVAQGKIWVNNHAHVLGSKSGEPLEYLSYFINSIDLTPYVTGSAQPKLSQGSMAKIVVPVPPLPEQAEIVRRVEALFAIADRLESRHKAASTHFSRLTPALLAKAFRGELVEQDPADEPASVLLERIRSQRAAAGAPAKAGGRGRRPKVLTPEAECGAVAWEPQEPQSEPRRGRGRPRKVAVEAGQAQAAVVPTASSYEEAVRLLQERGQARAEGARQAELFGEEVGS